MIVELAALDSFSKNEKVRIDLDKILLGTGGQKQRSYLVKILLMAGLFLQIQKVVKIGRFLLMKK